MRRLLVLALALLCAAWSPGTSEPAQYGRYGAPLPGYQAGAGGNSLLPVSGLSFVWDARAAANSAGNVTSVPEQVSGTFPLAPTNTCSYSAGTAGVLGNVPTWNCGTTGILESSASASITAPFTVYVVFHTPASLISIGYLYDSGGTAIRGGLLSFTAGDLYMVPVSALYAGPALSTSHDYIAAIVMQTGNELLYLNSSASSVATGTDAINGASSLFTIGNYHLGANGGNAPELAVALDASANYAQTARISAIFAYYAAVTGNAWN